MPLPPLCVVDTNVPILANGTDEAELTTVSDRCVDAVLEITRRGGLVLDYGDLIFDEYRNNLRLAGQPGTGDMFMKWVHDNSWNPAVCHRVVITPSSEAARGFNEFPEAPALADFDPSDRKFVAVANALPGKPPILEAVDYKWWGWRDALRTAGVTVQFLDPALAERKYREHMGDD